MYSGGGVQQESKRQDGFQMESLWLHSQEVLLKEILGTMGLFRGTQSPDSHGIES